MSTSPNDGRKKSKRDQTRLLHVLTWWLLPDDVSRRVEEARQEEQVVVELRRVVAKDVVVDAFLRRPFLGSTNRGRPR